jgi:PAS domain S-box-containing protein
LGLEEAVRQMPAAVVIVEAPSGRIIHVNDQAREMTQRRLGRTIPGELMDYFDIFHLDGRPYEMAEWPLVRAITAGEQVVDEEYFNVLADGSRLIVRCCSAPVYNDQGGIVAGVLMMHDVTEHKRIEERLAYHSRLLESIEDAVVATDVNFVITTWNKGAEALYGQKAEEVIGRSVRDVIRLEMTDAERDAVRLRTTELGRVRIETVSYRKDGTPVDVEAINIAVHDDRGQITGYLGIHRDVTERRRAEAHIAYHARLLENLNDAVLASDERHVLTAWNKGAETMFGWTAEEALGRTVDEVIPTVYSEEELADAVRPVAETGHRFTEGRLWRRRDGSSVCAETRSIAMRGDGGEITGYVSIMRDIAESVRAQEEIERRARQQAAVAQFGLQALTAGDLQSLMDDAVALIARTLDVEYGTLVELLPGGEDLLIRAGFGWRKGTLRNRTEPTGHGSQAGQTLLSGEPVVAEDLASETRFSLSPLVRELQAVSGASVVVPTRGGPFGVLQALSKERQTFSDDDVNFLRAIANVLATAVERGEGEQRLREVREGERRRIARDLHDDALRGLAHALAEAHRAQLAFQDSEAAAPLSGLSAALQQVGQQLRGAIYDLRLGGEVDRPFPELLESLIGLHRSMAGDFEIELDARDGMPTGPLGRTGTEILRILSEALTNARRHSGARRVRVGVWGTDDTLWVDVSDHGRGFDPARPPGHVNGAGIKGMRERANAIGGSLHIRSEPGAGTRVRLELSLKMNPQDALDHVRILLVDDHAAVRQAVASALDREPGFEVVGQAASLAEARAMLDEVDVAVVDLGLPDGYGGELIEELREASPRAQALVLTASVDRADIARAVESGAAGVLSKTAPFDQVVEAVRRLRAGGAVMPLTEVVELLRFAGRQREQEREDRLAIGHLTPRERDVLQALAQGLNSQEIARQLQVSLRTERNHVASILVKLGVHSRLQALVFALRHGLVEVR